jgi:hypothetical protein
MEVDGQEVAAVDQEEALASVMPFKKENVIVVTPAASLTEVRTIYSPSVTYFSVFVIPIFLSQLCYFIS